MRRIKVVSHGMELSVLMRRKEDNSVPGKMSVDIRIEYQPELQDRMHRSAAAAATYQIRLVINEYQVKHQYLSRARAKKKLLAASIKQSLNKVGPARSTKRCKENAAIRVRDEDLIMHLVAYL